MTAERLEEARKLIYRTILQLNSRNMLENVDVENYYWLLEQAERVQELEEFKQAAEKLYKSYHINAKISLDEKEKLKEEIKRLREALEFYAKEENHHYEQDWLNDVIESEVMKDSGLKARQAIKGGK